LRLVENLEPPVSELRGILQQQATQETEEELRIAMQRLLTRLEQSLPADGKADLPSEKAERRQEGAEIPAAPAAV
jgi:hypothetical protein